MFDISLLHYIKLIRDNIFLKMVLISLWKAELRGIFIENFDRAELRIYCIFAGITVLKTQFYM